MGSVGAINATSAIIKGLALASPIIIWFLTDVFLKKKIKKDILVKSLNAILPLIILALIGIISSLWSPTFITSFTRAFSLLILLFSVSFIVSIFLINKNSDVSRIINLWILAATFWIGLIVGMGAAGVDVAWRYDGRLGGVIISTNTLGAFSAQILGLSVINLVYRRSVVISLAGVFVATIALYWCYSRSSFIALFIGVFIVFVLRGGHSQIKNLALHASKTLIIIIALTTVFFIFNGDSAILSLLTRDGENIQDLYTATSRTLVWREIFSLPFYWYIMGFGYAVLSPDGYVRLDTFLSSHAHNGYIQVLSGVGLIGIFFLFQYIIRVWKVIKIGIKFSYKDVKYVEYLFWFFIINNLSESSIGYQIYPQLVGMLLITTVYSVTLIDICSLKSEHAVNKK